MSTPRYCAADVAACIVNMAISNGKPVSNLQLQKILYFAQRDYIRTHDGNILFDDSFEAWQYGPVVPSVYRSYSIFGGSPIYKAAEYRDFNIFAGKKEPIEIVDGAELASVAVTYREWGSLPAWQLVESTHKPGGAWDSVYNRDGKSGSGYKDVIPVDAIRNDL